MITLISESKTMNRSTELFTAAELRENQPMFLATATEIIRSLADYNADQLAQILKISPRYASEVAKMVYDFSSPGSGLRAGEAFTGVVFKSARIPLMDESERNWANDNLIVCSSLYGLLRMQDIVKPYRMDYKTRIPLVGGETLVKFWKPKLTIALGRMLNERGDRCIINLMASESASCFDWKLLKNFASVAVIDFKRIADGGKMITPGSVRLKELRGEFIRALAEARPRTIDDVRAISTDSFVYDCDAPYRGILRFVCD